MKNIYIEHSGIPKQRKLWYGMAFVLGLPALYFAATQLRPSMPAAPPSLSVTVGASAAPVPHSVGVSSQASEPAPVQSATFDVAQAQVAYDRAFRALSCAQVDANQAGMQAAIAEMESEEAQNAEAFVALQAELCRDARLREDVVEDLMKRAAAAGNLNAQHYFLNRQAMALEEAQYALRKGGGEAAPTAASVALVQQMKQIAYTSGDTGALQDLARIYSNGYLTAFDPVMASALQTVALNEGKPKVSLIDEILSESTTQQEKDEILAKAQEIFQQCCTRPTSS